MNSVYGLITGKFSQAYCRVRGWVAIDAASASRRLTVLRAIDKLDRLGEGGVKELLALDAR